MSKYTITFPEEGKAHGNWPPYAAIRKVLELVAVQEENAPTPEGYEGDDASRHTLRFLTSMDPEIVAIRLAAPESYHPNLRTQIIVAKWCSDGFTQYLIWDSTQQDIVDMVEA